MKERPVLFSAPMVRALLDGSKTQTRRIMKPQPRPLNTEKPDEYYELASKGEFIRSSARNGFPKFVECCPYGKPGDRLWVRETHQFDAPCDGTWPHTEFYGCKGAPLDLIPERFRHPNFCLYAATWQYNEIVWRPSIHMPRWASRISLEVTGVRVEQLQDISEADAIAEGIPEEAPACSRCGDCGWVMQGGDPMECDQPGCGDGAVDEYRSLWEQINGAGSWALNPWVWCISFKRVDQE